MLTLKYSGTGNEEGPQDLRQNTISWQYYIYLTFEENRTVMFT